MTGPIGFEGVGDEVESISTLATHGFNNGEHSLGENGAFDGVISARA